MTGLLIFAVIMLILDLDRPGAGFIELSQQPMIDAAASIAAFLAINGEKFWKHQIQQQVERAYLTR